MAGIEPYRGHVAETFRILTVCTANVCRSALAAEVLRQWGASQHLTGVISVESAGTDAFPGAPMCAEGASVAGVRGDGHAARELTAGLLADADLILTADRTHRAAAARLLPSCRPRLFTLRQAATLAATLAETLAAGHLPEGAPPLPDGDPERLRWLVAELDAARGQRAGAADEDDDIEDQHGPEPHPGTLAEIVAATGQMTDALTSCLRSDRVEMKEH